MRERKKPTKSFITRSIEEIEKEAFKKGYEVGKKEMIEKAELWLLEKGRMYVICESDITDLIHDWRKAMEE